MQTAQSWMAAVMVLSWTACGGESTPSGGPVAGPEADASDTAAGNYCADESAFLDRCDAETSEACRAVLETTCSNREAKHSTALKQAVHSCLPELTCDDLLFENECVRNSIKESEPSAGQQRLAVDFCAACARADVVREEGLSCEGHVVKGTGPTLGPTILGLSDAEAAAVGSSCVEPARAAYPDDYANCENEFFNCIAARYERSASCE
ncbi:MAG: hypothetical protein KIS78_16900 [Labilithrix sp.]|nr:hypothetical protein [Labilithrix sp.]